MAAATPVIFEAGLLAGIAAGLPHIAGTGCKKTTSGQRIAGKPGKDEGGANGG